MNADERHEDLTGMDRIDRIRKGSFTMKNMKGVSEGKPGNAALRSSIIDFAVPATNVPTLDHARRAAGGE